MKQIAVFLMISLCVMVDALSVKGCLYEGKWYPEGSFKPSPCYSCRCDGGQAHCAVKYCGVPCVDSVRKPDQCCPICPNGPNCRGPSRKIIPAGKHVQVNKDTFCTCPEEGRFNNQALCVKTVRM